MIEKAQIIEKAYGVTHGAYLEDAFGHNRGELLVSPSDGLYEELGNLPKESVVGIEFHPRLKEEFNVDFITLHPSNSAVYYWDQIEKFCSEKGLKVVHLEDIETYQKYVNEVATIEDLSQKQDSLENQYLSERDYLPKAKRAKKDKEFNEEHTGVIRDIYRHEIIRDYIHQVEREEKLFENISKINPTVVILGYEHTKTLIRKRDSLCDDLGIQIRGYKFESPEKVNRFDKVTKSELTDYQGESVVSLDTESLKRKYLAITTGEIIPGGKPNYVGSWDIVMPEQGLFEIYINSQDQDNFSGIVEDVLGRAKISGTITDESIVFTKQYLKDESLTGVIQEEITYEGKREGNYYVGNYSSKDEFFTTKGVFFICSSEESKSKLKQSIVEDKSFLTDEESAFFSKNLTQQKNNAVIKQVLGGMF
jgi:hypothetical protein